MQQTRTPVSKTKMVLMWIILVGNILFWCSLWFLRDRSQAPAPAETEAPDLLKSIVTLVFGVFFLTLGIGSYLVVLFTNCFTFNFQTPFWNGLKGKLFVANIVVPIQLALGVGLALSAIASPRLRAAGLSGEAAFIAPVVGAVVILQIAQVWVLIWSPLEKRVIHKRLMALGITPEQLQTGFLIGISNPASGFLKRFGAIEEDIGVLWVGPEQLIYWGDTERFGITREQLVQFERKADTKSVTMLAGIAHVVLHVRLADGSERQIRLHTEGVSTLGKKRKAMEALADAILQWHGAIAGSAG